MVLFPDKAALRILFILLLLSPVPALAKTAAQSHAQPAQPAAPAGALKPSAPAAEPAGRQFGDWAAFQYTENGSVTCYAAAKSGEAYIYVTHRPSERTQYEFQFTAPGNLKPGSGATLQTDKKTFTLFVDGNNAWARGADNDKAIAGALRRARKISVRATDANGKKVAVNFGAKGSSLALQAIDQACGI